MPFLRHRYTGVVPPLAGVAVNVTFVPVQIGPEGLAATETDGATDVVTVIAIVLLFTVSMLLHVAFEVRRTVITSPFTNELLL